MLHVCDIRLRTLGTTAALNGVAIVSALMAASGPCAAATYHLKETFLTKPTFIMDQRHILLKYLKDLKDIVSSKFVYLILEFKKKRHWCII